MFFGEIETKLSEDALLSASLILDNNLSKVKISKGTKIDKSIIKLLLNNNIQKIMCAKLDQDDIDEDFIYFEGTSAGDSTRSLSSSTGSTGGKQGAIRVSINGVDRWIRFYDTAV